MAAADLAAELGEVPLLAGLSPESLRALAGHAHVRRLARDRILFMAGEVSEHLFIVRSGRLRVFVTSPRGDELTLAIIGPGGSLGELSVLDEQPRSASVDVAEPVELIAIAARDVRTVLESDVRAMRATAMHLAAMLRRISGQTADLVFLDLPRRLAKLLLEEAVTGPTGLLTSSPATSQSGIAARLGVTRQTLNRAVSGFVTRGWVTVDKSTFRLDDPAALRRFADS